ncbi:MAG: hypothetical protein AAF518_17510 [Spirochaetota bacterium]
MKLFDFNSWVWKNQRRQVRDLRSDSIWYRTLETFLQILVKRSEKVTWLWDNLFFGSSYGYGLDLWGARYRIPRLVGEKDLSYKDRIRFRLSYKQIAGTTANMKSVAAELVNVSSDKIIVERVYPNHFTIGGVIGSPIGTRDYAHYTYRIYIPQTDAVKRGLLLWAIKTIETAGSLYELWEYTTDDTGIKTQRLSETPEDAKSNFRLS